MPIKHLLFDNDGTIVDSEIIAVRAMLHLLAKHGLTLEERAYSQRYPGLLERDILALLQVEYGFVPPGDFFQQLRDEHILGFHRSLRAVPGMTVLFRNLKVPKSMVSNASVRHVEECLRKVRLRSALDGQIFSAQHVATPKPAPDVYLFALQQLGLEPNEALVVEDSPTGVRAASQAGLTTIGFLGAAHIFEGHAEKLLEAGADLIAKDAKALSKLLINKGVL